MGINPYVKPKEEKQESDLDKVLKGLNVASNVFGIYTDYKKLDQMKVDNEKQRELFKIQQGADVRQAEKHEMDKKEFAAKEKRGFTNLPTPEDPLTAQNKRLDIQKKTKELNDPYNKIGEADQTVVKNLSTKNATKQAITAQIEASLKILDDPTVSEDQKIIQGRTLLKTLNSAEGADAIGAEEAKRLGGLLEFQMFNFTNPGPMFGRAPIGDFTEQVKLQRNSLKDAIKTNQTEIDARLGTSAPKAIVKTPPSDAERQAAMIELTRRKGLGAGLPKGNK